MGFSGSLESINLADIFQNLTMNRQTGTLNVSERDRSKCIFFERGEVRFLSHGKRKNILLGEMLVGRGLATRAQVDAALAEQKASGRLLGEVLVDLGIASRKDIDDLVRFQIEEEIYDLFGWEHARFEFVEGPPAKGVFDPEQQATELAIDTSHLILEAARRIDEWERIRKVLPSMSEVLVPTVAGLPESVPPETQRIFAYLDGSRDVASVVEDSHFSRFEVAASVVQMLEAGQIRRATADELLTVAAACMSRGEPERAARLTETALSRRPADLSIRQGLAETLAALGENEKAAIHLGVIGDERARQGDRDGAAEAYERILAVLPKHVGAHGRLAEISAARGEKGKALGHYAALVRGLVEAGRLDEAAARCREGLALDATSTDMRSALATVLVTSGDREGAVAELENLGEIFARAGQMRPAAEAFRRILQIDPRNRHAKNRLSSILSGKGVGKHSHALSVILLLVLAALGGGAYVVLRELALQNRFEKAEQEVEGLLEQDRFAEARKVLEPFVVVWSVLGCREHAEQRLERVREREGAYKNMRASELGKRAAGAAELLREAERLHTDYELDGARDALKKVEDLSRAINAEVLELREKFNIDRIGTPPLDLGKCSDEAENLAKEAASRLAKIAEETGEADAFLEWKKRAEQRNEIASLEEELRRSREIVVKYPRNPRLQGLTRPLLVTTDPRGASLFVDGELRGTAPKEGIVIRFPLAAAHVVRAERKGYSVEQKVAPRDKVRLEIALVRKWAWRFESQARILSLATGPKGLLLVANQDGVLAAVDPLSAATSGETRGEAWSSPTDDRLTGITSGIAVRGNAIYYGTDKLYALDVEDPPRRRWSAPVAVGGRLLSPPTTGTVSLASSNEYVFGTCVDTEGVGAVWAVESASGRIPPDWRSVRRPSETGAPTRARALLLEETLYVPFDDGNVYALQTVDGKPAGTFRTGAPARLTSIAWDGRSAWVGTGAGRLCRIDLAAPATPAQVFSVGKSALTEITLRDGIAYVGDEEGLLHAFSVERLVPVWPAFRGKGRVTGAPAVSDRRVYFATSLGWVYAVDRATGRCLDDRGEPIGWSISLEQDMCGGVLFDGRFLYAGGSDGYVYAFDEQGYP